MDRKENEWSDDSEVVFIPDEYVRDIENSLYKMQTAQQEFRKSITNHESKITENDTSIKNYGR